MIAALPLPLRSLFIALMMVICVFLVTPMLIVIAASFTSADYIAFPPTGLSLRWYGELLADDDFMGSLLISLEVAAGASLVSVVLGTAASVALVRGNMPGLGAIKAFLLSPLALPGLVIGVAILLAVSAAGIAPAAWTMVGGHILITTPYVIRLTSAALIGFDRRIEQAAVNLGSTGPGAFLRVTLPNVLPGVLGGGLLAFIVSFEDVNVALFLSSPDVTTLPVRIFTLLTQESNPIASAAGSLLTIIVIALALIADRLFGLDRAVS